MSYWLPPPWALSVPISGRRSPPRTWSARTHPVCASNGPSTHWGAGRAFPQAPRPGVQLAPRLGDARRAVWPKRNLLFRRASAGGSARDHCPRTTASRPGCRIFREPHGVASSSLLGVRSTHRLSRPRPAPARGGPAGGARAPGAATCRVLPDQTRVSPLSSSTT